MRTTLFLAVFAGLAVSGFAEDRKPGEKDDAPAPPTAQDQSNAPGDVRLTAEIRRALMRDKALSRQAKNITIVSSGGRVTLRGSVQTADEKARIEQLAQQRAGEQNVNSLLEARPK
jgi:hyperosmotically inducible periplasmic protein